MITTKGIGGFIGYDAEISTAGAKGIFLLNDITEYIKNNLWPRKISEVGQEEYTTPGSYSWIAPEGVTNVSVVCVGGGGGGAHNNGNGGAGGGGGGLGWKNNISVVPGQSYTVVVGAAGARGASNNAAGGAGGNSYFIDTVTVVGYGGNGALNALNGGAGGSYVGDGGGSGGNSKTSSTADASGGGGAGGYSGNGGNAGDINVNNAQAGSGGGGGGGGAGGSSDAAGAGGGVGIYGEGANGAAGVYNGADGTSGGGGSGGTNGSLTGSTANPSTGGQFGGGGGGAELLNEHGPGGSGAVRIIWGGVLDGETVERAFPSTNTISLPVIYGAVANGPVSMAYPAGNLVGMLAIVITHNSAGSLSAPSGFTSVFSTTGDTYGYGKNVSYKIIASGETSVTPTGGGSGYDQTLIILGGPTSVSASYDWDFSVSGAAKDLSVPVSGTMIGIASDRGASTSNYPTISGASDATGTGNATYFAQRWLISKNYTANDIRTFTDFNDSFGSNFLMIVAT